MNGRKVGLEVLGVIMILMGAVFSLQGADYVGGSALMSGNPTYIYVGAVVAVVGILVLALGLRTGRKEGPLSGAAQQQTAK